MKLETNGVFLINKKESIKYRLNLIFQPFNLKNNNLDVLDLFKYIKNSQLKINLDIKADISDSKNMKGFLDCEIFTPKKDKIDINGNFEYGNQKNIDLKIVSDYLNISDVLSIIRTFTKAYGINTFDEIYGSGKLKADFSVKSDFKKIISNGKMFVENSKLKYKNYLLSDLNLNIDFSGNEIKLLNTKAKLQNYPIYISGIINNTADISIKADNLPVKDFINQNILKENNIDGTASFNASIKGNLKDIQTQANLTLKQLKIKNKKSGIYFKNGETKIFFAGQNAIINTFNTIINMPDGINSILLPKLTARIKGDILDIEKTNFYIDNIKAELSGNVTNLLKLPTFNNLKITIPSQNNLSGPKNSKISVNGEMVLNGPLNNIKLKGNVNVPKIIIPNESLVIQNVLITGENGIKINCPYISLNSSIIRINVLVKDILKPEISVINVYSDYLDINSLKAFAKKQNYDFPDIKTGTLKANKVKINDITAENVISKLSQKNNILYIDNLTADAYSGKIASDIIYDKRKNKTDMKLQGRGIETYSALQAVSGEAQDIHGRCDFDSKLSFIGDTQKDIQKNINGNIKFVIYNFISNNLGKLDYLIQAQNILNNRIMSSSVNVIKNALKLKDLGVYKTAKGEIHLDKGFAYINGLKLAGPSMSLYMTGRYYIPDNTAFMLILGKVSDDVVTALGPLGNIDTDYKYIPKVGSIASAYLSDVTTVSDLEDISKVPELTVKTNFKTQDFKVLINGRIDKQTSVQTFKWIKSDKRTPASFTQINQNQNIQSGKNLPDFVNKLPELKK